MNAPAKKLEPLSRIDELEARHFRIGAAVRAASRRSDVRELRSKIVLILLAMRCPVGRAPRRRWYVPGGVARLGAEGIRRAWPSFWPGSPPTVRTVRAHLGALESAGVLVRGPGDWLASVNPEAPHKRPRYPDTFHILDDEEEAEWWQNTGRALLEKEPSARHSPDRWRMLFGRWRDRLRDELAGLGPQPMLPGLEALAPPTKKRPPAVQATPKEVESSEGIAERLSEVVHRDRVSAGEIVGTLDRCGIHLRGAMRSRMQGNLYRLRGAAALLALALLRGDRVRNRPGWVVSAWNHARDAEVDKALRALEPSTTFAPGTLADALGVTEAAELLEGMRLTET